MRRTRSSTGLVSSACSAQSKARRGLGSCSRSYPPSAGRGDGRAGSVTGALARARKRARWRTPERGPHLGHAREGQLVVGDLDQIGVGDDEGIFGQQPGL
jgi:hypothetical protein